MGRRKQPDTPTLPRRPRLPRVAKPPILPRGPAVLRPALAKAEVLGTMPGPMPPRWKAKKMTLPEWYVYWALTRLGKTPNVDFEYRQEVKYAASLAQAAQLDFKLLDGSLIAFEVQGLHWHYQLGQKKIAADTLRSALLAPWKVIFLDEDDVLRAPLFYVREGLAGRDHSFRRKPYFVKPF